MVMGEKSLLVAKMRRWLRRAVSLLILIKHSSGPTSCWCSWASAHILPGLPSICSAGCSPGPSSAAASAQSCPVARPARCPQVGKVGKPPSEEEHQDNGIPRFGALWKHSFLSVSAGLSNEDKQKSNREDDLVAQGISSKVSLVNMPSSKLSSPKTKLHQLDIFTK